MSARAQEQVAPENGSGRRRQKQPKHGKVALYRASVVKTAAAAAAVSSSTTKGSAVVDDAILLKIKKCFERGNHPNTSEHEAKAALHLASRWMAMHNVSQAQLFAQEEAASSRIHHAGRHQVRIHRVDGDYAKPVRMQGHVEDLCVAMQIFFNCKFYTAGGFLFLEVSFYGIDANAAAAADAFEMTFNLVADWALAYKGNGPRESYCLGISDELVAMAGRERRAEEVRARRAEETARREREAREDVEQQARLSRLTMSSLGGGMNGGESAQGAVASGFGDGGNSERAGKRAGEREDGDADDLTDEEDSVEPTFKIEDDEDEKLDVFGDFDETIRNLIKQEARSTSREESGKVETQTPAPATPKSPSPERKWNSGNAQASRAMETAGWASQSQLVLFRRTADAIADEYVKANDLKLSKSCPRAPNIRDWNAYSQGSRDADKIDVRGRIKRIKG